MSYVLIVFADNLDEEDSVCSQDTCSHTQHRPLFGRCDSERDFESVEEENEEEEGADAATSTNEH